MLSLWIMPGGGVCCYCRAVCRQITFQTECTMPKIIIQRLRHQKNEEKSQRKETEKQEWLPYCVYLFDEIPFHIEWKIFTFCNTIDFCSFHAISITCKYQFPIHFIWNRVCELLFFSLAFSRSLSVSLSPSIMCIDLSILKRFTVYTRLHSITSRFH